MRALPLLLSLILFSAPAARAEEPKAPILVVSLRRILDESKEGKEFVGKLQERMAEKKKEIQEQVRKLQEKNKALLEVKLPDRDIKWYEQVRRVLDEMGALKAEEQYFVARTNDDIARRLNQLIRGAQQEARAIMKQRGATLVLLSRMGPVQVNSNQDLNDEMIFRRVLCARDSVDITDEVIERMDKWYEENRSSGAGLPEREQGGGAKPKAKPPEKKSSKTG